MKTIVAERTEQDIFEELSALCASPGYIHVIAYFSMRDNMIKYSGSVKPEDMANLHGHSRLIRTEITVLLGLLVKHEIDYAIPAPDILQQYADRSEALLEELHYAMSGDLWTNLTPQILQDKSFNPFTSGAVLRESIFYGGESAYNSQYRDFSPLKYGCDDPWLISNMGYSIHEGHKVAQAVGLIQNMKPIECLEALRKLTPDQWTYLPGNEFTAAEVAEHARLSVDVVELVLDAFTVSGEERNAGYHKLQDFNAMSAFPLIKHGDSYTLFNIYSLTEALYQSPFYWMWADKSYRATAMENRGKFTEEFSARRLASVFGERNVHLNVKIFASKGTVTGEIDVLVLFGDRVIILQAKSKQLTIAARQGDDKQLRTDFEQAIQASCDQAYSCARLLLDAKATFKTVDGVEVILPADIKNVYVLCVIADHYPALSFQTRQFLKFDHVERVSPPFVMDVFLLDTMAEMLDSPLHYLSYVDRRTNYNDRFMSSHELNILGYHLRQNLWIGGAHDLVMLDDDIGTELDLSMLVRRENIPGPRTPNGVLTRLSKTTIGRLLKQIERERNPAMLAFGFVILTLSEKAVVNLSKAIDEIARRAREDGNPHNISVPIEGGKTGITVHCNFEPMETARDNLMTYCMMRKYAQKVDGWFGICIDPNDGLIRFGGHLDSKWELDTEMDELTKGMAKPNKFDSSILRKLVKRRKVGRNDPCHCGSGKKSKKCCLL